MTLEQAIEKAAELLPEGWSISINAEKDAGYVTANRPDGSEVLIDSDGDLCEQVIDAIKLSLDKTKPI